MDINGRGTSLELTQEISLHLSVIAVFFDFPGPHLGGIEVTVSLPTLENLVMFWEQADFLADLTEQAFLHGFLVIDSALRKLPSSRDIVSLTDEQIAIFVDDQRCDVGAIFYHVVKCVWDAFRSNN